MDLKKLAIFVEGQTELILISKLVEEIGTASKLNIKHIKLSGPSTARKFEVLQSDVTSENTCFQINIYDSSNDKSVFSDVLYQRPSLQKRGFSKVIGLRDLFPNNNYTELDRVKEATIRITPTSGIETVLLFAVMEAESWFIANYEFFPKLNKKMTLSNISTKMGYDITSISYEEIANPANELKGIFNKFGRTYKKKKKEVQNIVNAIDYNILLAQAEQRVPHLHTLIRHLDSFFDVS